MTKYSQKMIKEKLKVKWVVLEFFWHPVEIKRKNTLYLNHINNHHCPKFPQTRQEKILNLILTMLWLCIFFQEELLRSRYDTNHDNNI